MLKYWDLWNWYANGNLSETLASGQIMFNSSMETASACTKHKCWCHWRTNYHIDYWPTCKGLIETYLPEDNCFIGHTTRYKGTVSVTESGRTCQEWSAQTPHRHTGLNYLPEHFIEGFLPSNYCRSPPGDPESRPWCYTTDPGKRWEHCDVRKCTPQQGRLESRQTGRQN